MEQENSQDRQPGDALAERVAETMDGDVRLTIMSLFQQNALALQDGFFPGFESVYNAYLDAGTDACFEETF